MRGSYSRFISKQTTRRLLGAAFLIVLFAEWGSHGLAFSHTATFDGAAIHSSERGHDDPCNSMIRCPDGRQQDAPNIRYDGSSHSLFLNNLLGWRPMSILSRPPIPQRERIEPLSRPVSPPFHPPELS